MSQTRSTLVNPERLRPAVEDALDKLFLTDACLLFSPAQIALAAILHAVSKLQENLDSFVTETLLGPTHKDYIVQIIGIIRREFISVSYFHLIARVILIAKSGRAHGNSVHTCCFCDTTSLGSRLCSPSCD